MEYEPVRRTIHISFIEGFDPRLNSSSEDYEDRRTRPTIDAETGETPTGRAPKSNQKLVVGYECYLL